MFETTLFTSKEGRFDNYRIPAIACTASGALVAMCEARESNSDWAASEILMRRSADGGQTWSEPITAAKSDKCLNNPVLIADGGMLHFLWHEEYMTLYHQVSADDGLSFSAPEEIAGVFERFPYQGKPQNARASGPGHGAVTAEGDLIVPVWFAYGEERAHRPSRAGCIIGHDHGRRWEAGGLYADIPDMVNPSENSIAALPDGRLYASLRTEYSGHRRAQCYSADSGLTWSEPEFRDDLPDPICLGTAAAGKGATSGSLFLVNNADSERRMNLRLRRSDDFGATWDEGILISEYGGYPDIVISNDGSEAYVYCERFLPEKWELVFAKVSLL